jgi:hypothetical protein
MMAWLSFMSVGLFGSITDARGKATAALPDASWSMPAAAFVQLDAAHAHPADAQVSGKACRNGSKASHPHRRGAYSALGLCSAKKFWRRRRVRAERQSATHPPLHREHARSHETLSGDGREGLFREQACSRWNALLLEAKPGASGHTRQGIAS